MSQVRRWDKPGGHVSASRSPSRATISLHLLPPFLFPFFPSVILSSQVWEGVKLTPAWRLLLLRARVAPLRCRCCTLARGHYSVLGKYPLELANGRWALPCQSRAGSVSVRVGPLLVRFLYPHENAFFFSIGIGVIETSEFWMVELRTLLGTPEYSDSLLNCAVIPTVRDRVSIINATDCQAGSL